MKEIGGKTHKDIIFHDAGPKWRAVVQRCEELTKQDGANRAAITAQHRAGYWRKHVQPELPPALTETEEAGLAAQMQRDMGRFGR